MTDIPKGLNAHIPELIEDPKTLFCGHKHIYTGEAVETAPHHHSKTQILYASQGIIRLKTADGIFVIPPSRAIWIPAYAKHALYFCGVFESTNLYVADRLIENIKQEKCRLFLVDTLLRELLLKASEIEAVSKIEEKDHNLVKVLFDLIKFDDSPSFYLPRPKDPRLKRLVERLENDLSDNSSLGELSKAAGASLRTMTRLFKQEMQMNFKSWRGQLRVFRATELLAMGQSVTEVAYDVGFESVSAFVSHFKKITGKTPSKYF